MRVLVEADGGSRGNPGPAGYGAVVMDAETRRVLAERAESIGRASNNVAEYSGLIAGLEAAVELGATSVAVQMDSKLVVEQMSGRWQVKHPDMRPLARRAQELGRNFDDVTFRWIPREQNKHADRLANQAMDAAATGSANDAEPVAGPQLALTSQACVPRQSTVSFQVPIEVRQRADAAAAARKITVAELAREALERLLATTERLPPAQGTAPRDRG